MKHLNKWLALLLALALLGAGALAEGLEIEPEDEQAVLAAPEEEAALADAEVAEEAEFLLGEADGAQGYGYADFVWDGEAPAEAAVMADSDFVINSSGRLTNYLGFDKDVVIPSGVTAIGADAFSKNDNLETVTIPDGVTSIGDGAFEYCKNLRSASIPESVTAIGIGAFMGCESLESLVLPSQLTRIEAFLACDCAKLEAIDLPAGITYIDTCAFSGTGIRSVTIPAGVKGFSGEYGGAFASCSNLESVYIPATITSINRRTFENSKKVVIRGETGSYAERFAEGMGIPFNAPIVSFERADMALRLGSAYPLVAIQSPGDLATDLVWSSSDSGVVTVDQSGNIAPVAPGTATITAATADGRGKAGEISVTVPQPSTINLTANSDRIKLNSTLSFPIYLSVQTPKFYGKKATEAQQSADNPVYTPVWTISDSSVLALESLSSPSGKQNMVTPLSVGKATVTVTTPDGGSASVEIEVYEPEPTGVHLNRGGTITLNPGSTLPLTASMSPSDAVSTLTWSTSSAKVATVDENGVVTPVGTGTATITVSTANGHTASVNVKVPEVAPKKVKIQLISGKTAKTVKQVTNVKPGKKLTLKALVTPVGATTKLTWKSSDKKIATVSKKGVVKAKKAGKVKITVTTANGKKATVTVTVKKK